MGSNGIGYLKNVLKPELYAYFKNYYDPSTPTYTVTHYLLDDQGFPVDFLDFNVFDPDRPTNRGLIEDLHLALSYNNLTRGWNPEHPLYLYHSVNDKAVPVCNRSSAAYYFGKWGKMSPFPKG